MCAHAALAAGKLHEGRVLSGLHRVVASWKGYVRCSLSGSAGSVWVQAELVYLTRRGAPADGCCESWWRGSGTGRGGAARLSLE